MNSGLYSGAAALRASERQLDIIANNLANVDTAGYKRQGTAAHAFRVPAAGGVQKGLTTVETVDWRQGNLLRTGNVYDVALFGDGAPSPRESAQRADCPGTGRSPPAPARPLRAGSCRRARPRPR
jgi:flagellar hook protein FlgE